MKHTNDFTLLGLSFLLFYIGDFAVQVMTALLLLVHSLGLLYELSKKKSRLPPDESNKNDNVLTLIVYYNSNRGQLKVVSKKNTETNVVELTVYSYPKEQFLLTFPNLPKMWLNRATIQQFLQDNWGGVLIRVD